MSRPTSKKESKELLKFFNSIQKEQENDYEIELITVILNIYIISIIYIFYRMFSVFF